MASLVGDSDQRDRNFALSRRRWTHAAREAVEAFKVARDLLPKGKARDEAEAKLAQAENLLCRGDARLALDLGYPLCQCTFPPQIMLWRETDKAHACPRQECGRTKRKGRSISPTAVAVFERGGSNGWMKR